MTFRKTLAAADSFIAVICCENEGCDSADELQLIGSCKHSFCNECVQKMQIKSMPSCDLCSIPFYGKDVNPARTLMELHGLGLALREAIANIGGKELDRMLLDETLQALNPDETRRTVGEFCLTQRLAEADVCMEDVERPTATEPASSHAHIQLFSSLEPERDQMAVDEQSPTVENVSPPVATHKDQAKSAPVARGRSKRPLEAAKDVVFAQPDFKFFSKKPAKTYIHAGKRSELLPQPTKPDGVFSFSQHLLDEAVESPMSKSGHHPVERRLRFESPTSSVSSPSSSSAPRSKSLSLGTGRKSRSTIKRAGPVNIDTALGASIAPTDEQRAAGTSRSLSAGRRSSTKNRKGERPLQVACISGDYQTITELLEQGENPNVADNAGWTPLHEAAFKEYPTIVRLLLDHGALVDVPGDDCQTALHRAAVGDSLESAELLIKWGADCEARDLYNQTPLDLAKSNPMRRLLTKGRPPGALVSVQPKVAGDWAGSKANGVYIVFSNTVSDGDLKTRAQKWLKKQKTKTVDCVDERTTHLICRIDSNGRVVRSTQVVEAILRGVWIVSEAWMEQSILEGKFVLEEPFEAVGLVLHEQCVGDGGPTKARLAKMRMLPGLFRGAQFYIYCNPRVPGVPSKALIETLIRLGDGQLLRRDPTFNAAERQIVPFYSTRRDSESGSEFSTCGLFVVYLPGERLPPKRIFDMPVHFVTPTWFLDCVSKFSLVPVDPRPEW